MGLEYALGQPVMMQLGAFQFGISTAAYQGLSRSDEWRWASQDRFGQAPALQHTGEGAATINLDGVIYPEWRGGLGQIDAMRVQAGKGVPLVLVDGRGRALGMWVIETISESQSVFAAGGVARRVEFTMQLKRYSAKVTGPVPKLPPLPAVVAPAASVTEGAVATLGQAATQAQGLAAAAAGQHAAIEDGAGGASASMAGWLKSAAGAAKRCAETAAQVRDEATQAAEALRRVPGGASVVRAMTRLTDRTGRLRTVADSARAILQSAADKDDGSAPGASRAVLGALASSGQVSGLCRQLAGDAVRAIEAAEKAGAAPQTTAAQSSAPAPAGAAGTSRGQV